MNKKLNLISASLLVLSASLSTAALAETQWPDLPVGLVNGVSAQVGDKVFVGLGSAAQDFYMLDLKNVKQGWQKKANFTGPVRSGSTASVLGKDIYVFGGSGKANPTDVAPVIFDTVYRYNTTSNSWSKIDATSPVGLLGASSYSPDGQQIVFFGGYHKPYFDKYLSDITTINAKTQPKEWQQVVDDYMGMQPLDYKWNRNVLSFNPTTSSWSDLGMSPYIPNCGAALVADGKLATLISGEIKPGLRTAEVKQYAFDQAQPWTSQLSLPAPHESQVQEGVAGAFAGNSNDVLIVAGGANFHGAKLAFEGGNMFAHNGFGKSSNPEMYVQNNGLWSQVNDLPEGLAYGASFTIGNGVLIAGGEKNDRSASNKVYLLSWNGSSVDIQD